MLRKVFITYNPGSTMAEQTAFRMQTLAHLYGFEVLLPYRPGGSNRISQETKRRIDQSQFVLAFDLGRSRNIFKQEIQYAQSMQKPVILLKDKKRSFLPVSQPYFKEFFIDYYNTEDTLHEIARFIDGQFKEKEKEEKRDQAFATALVGIGLGLLAYWFLSAKQE